jgi:hypothetical protein
MTLGSGTICSISTKQKVNTQCSVKLVGFDVVKLFIEAQDFEVNPPQATLSIETIPDLCDWKRIDKICMLMTRLACN